MDGYKLDAKHDQPIEADDLPALADTYLNRDALWQEWQARAPSTEWKAKWWFADIGTIAGARLQPVGRALPTHEPDGGRASRSGGVA